MQQSLDRALNEVYTINTKDTSSLVGDTIIVEVPAMLPALEGQPESSAEQVVPELLRGEMAPPRLWRGKEVGPPTRSSSRIRGESVMEESQGSANIATAASLEDSAP